LLEKEKGERTMDILKKLDREMMRHDIPPMQVGDQVKVHTRVVEGEKERIQIYEGVLIGKHNRGVSSTFTVRKVSYGVGVERIFPHHSPSVVKVEVIRQSKVRRAKLYYLRSLRGKAARLREKSATQ
jgi:large subunit ribosomal protein L19